MTNGTVKGQWNFLEDEWKEIGMLETDTQGNNATVVAHLQTGDDKSELEGKIKLYYERVAGKWELSSVENIDCRFTRIASNATPSPSSAVAPVTPTVISLLNSSIVVGAGRHYYLKFHTDGPARVVGEFRAQGGGGK